MHTLHLQRGKQAHSHCFFSLSVLALMPSLYCECVCVAYTSSNSSLADLAADLQRSIRSQTWCLSSLAFNGMSECFTNRKQGLIRVISTGLWGHATHLTSNSLIWTLYKHTKHNGHTLESTSSHKHLLTSQKQTSMRHNGVSDTDWQMFVLWGACSCHMMRSSEM